jgi:hypothetical protein
MVILKVQKSDTLLHKSLGLVSGKWVTSDSQNTTKHDLVLLSSWKNNLQFLYLSLTPCIFSKSDWKRENLKQRTHDENRFNLNSKSASDVKNMRMFQHIQNCTGFLSNVLCRLNRDYVYRGRVLYILWLLMRAFVIPKLGNAAPLWLIVPLKATTL